MTNRRAINLSSRVVAASEHVSCELASEIVILSLRTGEYYGLNPVAASIWELIRSPKTVASIRDALLEEYEGITPHACEAEVLEVLARMAEMELVEVIDPAGEQPL